MSSTDLEGTVKRDFGLFLKSDFDFGHFRVEISNPAKFSSKF